MIEHLTRALSIRQPFAEFILTGEKDMEFRSRQTHIRGRVYIYAGKNLCDALEWAGGDWKLKEVVKALPRGLIVGSVEIIGCVPEARRGYAWLLGEPRRYREPWKPMGTPQPGLWRPRLAPKAGT